MQSLARLMIMLVAFMSVALASCDGATPPEAGAAAESSGTGRPATSIEAAIHTGTHARIRARADAAFAALDSNRRMRSESRIGPQAWPEDLPADWPRPDHAQLLADTRRDKLGRLLLVDLPDTRARALDAYQEALRQNGFEVRRPRSGNTGHALHVRRGELEAILTFIDRERTTRLEILFLCERA